MNGWSFGNNFNGSLLDRDRHDAVQVYDLLEREVVPLYYTVGDDGLPHMWVKKMKEAIRTTAHQFSSRRMLKDYVRMGYDPALKAAAQYKK